MNKPELAKRIYQVSHLTGQFKLRSGLTSTEYFDKYRFESKPEILREVAKQLVPLVPAGTEILAGLEMGGIPIATAISLETGIPVCFVRKRAKDYGTCQFAEGTDVKGKKVCVVEDIITTGGQVVLSSQDLKSLGAEVIGVICVIHRGSGREEKLEEAGLKMKCLFTQNELNQASATT